jgi:DNA topoisomerase-3
MYIMQLIIAEKPSVGEAISKVVGAKNKQKGYNEGEDCIVTWCVGHLVEFVMPEAYDEKYKSWSFENLPIIPEQWHMGVAKDKVAQFSVIKKLLNDSRIDEIVCATDAAREGECIFRYVYRLSRCNKPVMRLWISSNEETEIRKGLANMKPDSDYDNLYAAGLCRAKADWLIGINCTRIFTSRYNSLLSVGRVKTPTLALIVQRDYDIEHFVKKKYFTAELDLGEFTAVSERIDDETQADKIISDCNGKTAVVNSVKKEVKTANPPKLFSLSTLQTAASKKFGYTAKQTLDIVQSLYDSPKRLCTYPRTSSEYLTDDMEESTLNVVNAVRSAIPDLCNMEYEPNVKRCINSKKVDDHHALLPTAEIATYNLSSLKDEERNILSMIAGRLLTATAPPHKYESTKVSLSCENHEFTASGKVVIEDGFKAVEKQVNQKLKGKSESGTKTESEKTLPQIAEGQRFENVTAQKLEHWTTPPAPFTDGTLISEMKSVGKTGIIDEEKREEIKGIGTEATRAAIIEELVKQQYIERVKAQIHATKRGCGLIAAVPDEVKSPQMTADWESRFHAIEKGEADSGEFLTEIEKYIREIMSKYGYVDENSQLSAKPIGKCPICGKNVYERSTFYACESGKSVCGFGMSKTICGKQITADEFSKILNERKSGLIKGFKGKSGKKFDAYLVLTEENKIGFSLPERVQTVVGKCPRCGKNIVEYPSSFSCESGKDGCGFTLWKNDKFKKITLTARQATALLKGECVSLNATSKSGKKYTGNFRLVDTGKYVNLEFVPDK